MTQWAPILHLPPTSRILRSLLRTLPFCPWLVQGVQEMRSLQDRPRRRGDPQGGRGGAGRVPEYSPGGAPDDWIGAGERSAHRAAFDAAASTWVLNSFAL